MDRWVNRDDIDFAAAERMPAVQEWELQPENAGGVLEYPTQVRCSECWPILHARTAIVRVQGCANCQGTAGIVNRVGTQEQLIIEV